MLLRFARLGLFFVAVWAIGLICGVIAGALGLFALRLALALQEAAAP